jgi:exodeoxyribonuclease V alpha subunit
LLTGGPGTGKTFTAAELVKASFHQHKQMRIILTAPTGKAVAQLEGNLRNALGPEIAMRAATLHAILGIKAQPFKEEGEEEVTTLFADLIIVDECSMIDVKIFSQLLASIPKGARLMLIGDKDQLPPVEAGSIFSDLIEADVYPAAYLTECLRSDRSEILMLSHYIKEGQANAAFQFLHESIDVSWIDLEENEKTSSELCASLWEQYQKRFATYYSQKPLPEHLFCLLGRFGFLSTKRQGSLGVEAINRYFLYQSIKQVPQGAWWVAPIMVTRNDYELELYNGDLGFLVRNFTGDFSLRQLKLDDTILLFDRKGGFRQIAALNLSFFEYSYCLSVHKSQGSEYDEALILTPPGSESFGKEILYTAVTRARHKVTLMCSRNLLIQTITTSSRKISGLCSRLKTLHLSPDQWLD